VSPEQLKRDNDHLTEFGRCIDKEKFAARINRVSIDEGHHIYISGTALNGRPAFRPSYGYIRRFLIQLKPTIPTQVLSATIPPHIRQCIIASLGFDSDRMIDIRLTTNRPNTVYWTHPIRDSLTNFSNLDFLVPSGVTEEDVKNMKPILIFYDSKSGSRELAHYLNSRFPENLRYPRQARHYNSYM
jgi:superfamily II DNA helicase RecQ